MATRLAEMRCTACSGDTPPLTAERIQQLLPQVCGWELLDGPKLCKRFKLRNFKQAVDFVNAVLPVAEGEGHHPDLYVEWGAVTVYLWTHKIRGLSENDFILAAKIDELQPA